MKPSILTREVCSDQMARTLRDLGVFQTSLFHYDPDLLLGGPDRYLQYTETCQPNYKCSAAFTAGELAHILAPFGLGIYGDIGWWEVQSKQDDREEAGDGELEMKATTLAEALAKMLAYLLVNKYVHIDDVNNVLMGRYKKRKAVPK